MSKRIVFQGVTRDDHLTAVSQILSIPNPRRILLSAAFVNERGLLLLEGALRRVARFTTVFAGIRNGITSAQGLRKSLEIGCTTYAVDTGARTVIFHPKIYFSCNDEEARLIVGSANLTVGGLNRNIEASLFLTLDLADPENVEIIESLETTIDDMIEEYEEHVFEISDAIIQRLIDSGRVVDESLIPAPTPVGSSRNRDLDSVPRMRLKAPGIAIPRVTPLPRPRRRAGAIVPPAAVLAGVAVPIGTRLILVWESSPLSRRYLDIPTGRNSNPTGSMLFTKGNMEGIDQRHYFRDEVFGRLPWTFDPEPRRRHIERALARFQLVVRDVNYGIYTLRLSHNTRRDTVTYEQGNSMTQLHWGEARDIVAHEDLLGRTMYLYRDELDESLFVLEID